MSDTPVQHKQRAHFPFINLSKALARAKELYSADPAGRPMGIPAAFSVWNYSTKSSGGHQTVAALRSYGLLDADGNLEARKIGLSAPALRYFKDERPEERLKLLQEFALRPKLFNQLWHAAGWRDSPPSDAVARSHLKIEKGLNEQAARAILGIYKDNITLAKLKGDDTIPETKDENDPPEDDRVPAKVGDLIQWTSNGIDQFAAPQRVVWVSQDRNFLRVLSSNTGIPMSEISVESSGHVPAQVAAKTTASAQGDKNKEEGAGAPDFSTFFVGGRLQISADVDAAGLKKLKEVLTKYEEIFDLIRH